MEGHTTGALLSRTQRVRRSGSRTEPATPNVVNQSWLDNRAAEDSPRPFFFVSKNEGRGSGARTVTIMAHVDVQRLEAIRYEPIGRPGGCRMWLVMMAVICAGLPSGCSSDSAVTKSANGHVDRTAESNRVRNHDQGEAITKGIEQVSASAPPPNEPVTATMVIRPETLSSGEAAELLV